MFECPPCPSSPCSLSGPMVELTLETKLGSDCCCIYTATATCNPIPADKRKQQMQFNGNAQSIPYPLTLICDTTTNQYTYDNSGIQTQITSAQCCQNTCGTINKQNTQVDDVFAPDATCTYHRILSCINGSPTMRINQPPGAQTGPGYPGPEMFPSGAVDAICSVGSTQYVHNSPMFGPNTPVGKAQCP
uniref:Sodefrin-like factor n=1 Tax=Panagrolaimus sp. PS1159 TaxID=55785 RepID=A0AC35GG38_9BILA